MTLVAKFLILLTALTLAQGAHAQGQGQFGKVIRIDRKAFSPDAGLLTFSEYKLGTRNPVYNPARYRARPNGVTVTFGGYYLGQYLSRSGQCPPGANRNGCVSGKPRAPLALDRGSPVTFIAKDGSNPRSPSLSGSPTFNGAVSMLFDKDVAGVGLVGGYFNAKNSTAIQAYDRSGNLIGGVRNVQIGMEFLALVTEDGADRIAGIQFSLVGPEPAGYAIDDLNFALAKQLDRGQIPALADVLLRDDKADQDKGGGLADLFGAPKKEAVGGLAPKKVIEKAPPLKKGKSSLADLFD